jgi:HEAT repeat protein
LIAKIRNMDEEKIKQQLIIAKSERFLPNCSNKTIFEKMLEMSKEERQGKLLEMPSNKKNELVKEIFLRYNEFQNPDDKMVLVWLIGELKIKKLFPLIYKDIKHSNGNIRRLVCSAIYKAEDKNGVKHLYKVLFDPKPQVRQYAAKALGKLGEEDNILALKKLLTNKNEKSYVKRTAKMAIEEIKGRLQK